MDDQTMTLHDVFMRHHLYKSCEEEVEATMRGERMAWIFDLLIGAAPAGGDLRTDMRLWHADLQARGLCEDDDVQLWLSMAVDQPDVAWLDPLLDRLRHRHDNMRCRYYLAVLGHESSARHVSRICEKNVDLSGAFAHGMHLHSIALKKSGSEFRWYPGIETAILVEGCRRLAGMKDAHGSVHAVLDWYGSLKRDRHRAREDGERQFLTALIRESQVRSMTRKAVDEGRIIPDPDEHWPRSSGEQPLKLDFDDSVDDAVQAAPSPPRSIDEVAAAVDAKIADMRNPVRTPASALRGHLVLADIPARKGRVRVSDSDLEASLAPIVGKHMDQVLVSAELFEIAEELRAEWPHATEIVDRILADLRVGEPVRFRPTLLVGAPGSGKTTLVKAICENLSMPSVVFPCASVSDGSFGGTPSQWSTRRASTPLELIRTSDRANPCVILDEIEKSGTSGHNGSLVSALLPMLERGTARAYFEVGIERNADLSAVSFFATANDVTTVPMPLRDRFRILRMPDPEPQHIGSLTRKIVSDLIFERDLDPRWTPPLAPDELDIIRRAWGGGSLRRLRRAVEATLAAREMAMTSGRRM